jgi:hypothetical protein
MPTTQGFFPFIRTSRANRLYLMIGLLVSIASWWLFKRYYPNTHIVFDSYYYIFAALDDDPVHVWPIGYSKFLQLVGLFSHSPNLVAASQYFFLQVTLLLFFFSMRFFFHLGKNASLVLFLFTWLNPIYLFTSNFILSDSLFMGISLLWLINLLWIVFRPRPWMLVTQALLLFLAFTIRQTALVYPLIACVAILLSRQRPAFKIGGIALPFLLVGGFIVYCIRMNEVMYGVKVFSPFQGWHSANNALYIYQHVAPQDLEPVPTELQPLDKLVRAYYNSPHPPVDVRIADLSSGGYYIFLYPSPLLVYKDRIFGPDRHFLINPATFAKLGPLYSAYGSFIIRKYPSTYFQYFVLPNIGLYVYPYAEAYLDNMRSFYLRPDTLGVIATKWFGKSVSVSAPEGSIRFRTALFSHYQFLFSFTHIVFVLSFLAFAFFKGFKKIGQPGTRLLLLLAALWLIQFGFTVAAAASVFRFQLFITVVEFAMLAFFIEFLVNSESSNPPVLKTAFDTSP